MTMIWCFLLPVLAWGSRTRFVDSREAYRFRGLTGEGLAVFFNYFLEVKAKGEDEDNYFLDRVPGMNAGMYLDLYKWRALEQDEFVPRAKFIMQQVNHVFINNVPDTREPYQEDYAHRWNQAIAKLGEYEGIDALTVYAYAILCDVPEEYIANLLPLSTIEDYDANLLISFYDMIVEDSFNPRHPHLAWPRIGNVWETRSDWANHILTVSWFDERHGPAMLRWRDMSMVDFVVEARDIVAEVHEKYMNPDEELHEQYVARHEQFVEKYGEERFLVGYARTLYGMLGCISPKAVHNFMNFGWSDTTQFNGFHNEEGDYYF